MLEIIMKQLNIKIYNKTSLMDWMRYRIESQLFESISDMDKFTLFSKMNEATWRINTLNTLIINKTYETNIKE